MGWSETEMEAADLALRAADIPMIAAQAIPTTPTTVKWVESAQVGGGDLTTWTDRVSSAAPAAYAFDGVLHYPTYHAATPTSGTWYLCFDMSATGIEFDAVLVGGHNFDTLGVSSVTLEIADDAAFSTNLVTVATLTLRGSDQRIADLTASHDGTPYRYSSVRYARLKVVAAGAIVPEVGELVLARTRQLERHIQLPFDDLALTHRVDATETESGVITGSTRYTNRGELRGNIIVSESAGIADLRAWYRQIRSSFQFIAEPNSNPNDWQMMWLRSPMKALHRGFTSRVLPIDAVEQGPSRFFLDNEING